SKETLFDVVLCDFRLGDKEGREVLREIKAASPQTVVIIITGYSDIKIAVDVIKSGAFDYITKPLVPDEVLNVIRKGLLAAESEPNSSIPVNETAPRPKPRLTQAGEFLVGPSALTRDLYKQLELVAPTNYSVILYGESGTGKEVMARTIHAYSMRKDKPFI